MRITKAGLKGMIFEVLNEIEYDVEDDGPEAFPFRIFCDMDGVLVDQLEAFLLQQNKTLPTLNSALQL